MTYLRIAYAAVLRYRIEKPYRDLFREHFPERRQRQPLGYMLKFLDKAGVVNLKELKPMLARYKDLSQILHGN